MMFFNAYIPKLTIFSDGEILAQSGDKKLKNVQLQINLSLLIFAWKDLNRGFLEEYEIIDRI